MTLRCVREILDQLEKEVTPSSKVHADVVRSGFLNTQKGASDGCQDGNKVSGQLHRYEHLSRMAAIDESESLSDIDDVEVDKYLHSKEEMHYKKIIWEQMNSKHETLDIEYMHLSDLKECHSIEACKTQEIETRCPFIYYIACEMLKAHGIPYYSSCQ
ncbi:hypothetical protein CsSME_00047507 [Camellia sinensis var. sinensis]